MTRGDVFAARLDPTEGSEQAGTRPVVVVSRDAINRSSPVVIVIPYSTARKNRRIYPSEVLVRAPEGGLRADSIVLGGQLRAVAKTRLVRRWGALRAETMQKIDTALLITLDLPGQ